MGRLPSSLPWHETPTPLKFSSAEERKAHVEFVDGATFVLSYETLEDIGIERSHQGWFTSSRCQSGRCTALARDSKACLHELFGCGTASTKNIAATVVDWVFEKWCGKRILLDKYCDNWHVWFFFQLWCFNSNNGLGRLDLTITFHHRDQKDLIYFRTSSAVQKLVFDFSPCFEHYNLARNAWWFKRGHIALCYRIFSHCYDADVLCLCQAFRGWASQNAAPTCQALPNVKTRVRGRGSGFKEGPRKVRCAVSFFWGGGITKPLFSLKQQHSVVSTCLKIEK